MPKALFGRDLRVNRNRFEFTRNLMILELAGQGDDRARHMQTAFTDLPDNIAAYLKERPEELRAPLLALRRLVFQTAAEDDRIGPLVETLKWGEPAYLTQASGAGTTLRLGWKRAMPGHFGMFFNCRTRVSDQIKEMFPDVFTFDGTRGLLFKVGDVVPQHEVKICMGLILTYHKGTFFLSGHRTL